jgi:hypothetical protein
VDDPAVEQFEGPIRIEEAEFAHFEELVDAEGPSRCRHFHTTREACGPTVASRLPPFYKIAIVGARSSP